MELSQDSAKLFEPAGQPNTIHIWRVQNFKPVKVPTEDFGRFYSGDSYLVLHSEKYSHHCHFWIGNQSTTDEYASAAFLTTALSDYLSTKTGKYTTHHREEQQYESPLFASYFPQTGIQYLKGGYASGFKKAQLQTFEPRLLHVKGVRPVRAFEVAMSGDSVNDGDAFIADIGSRVVLWYGSQVNMREKAEAIKIVNSLVSKRGKSKCSYGIANENEEIEKEFWAMLGGKPGKVKDAISDENVDENFSVFKFYRMVHDGDNLNIEEIADRPLKAEMLESQDCFLLELPRELFWWTGKGSEIQEKKAAREYIDQLVKNKHKSVTRVIEGMEDGIFRSYFHGFNRPTKIDFTKNAEERKQAEIDFESLWKEKQQKSVPLFKKQDITDLAVHRVDNQGNLSQVENTQYGYFFEEDCIIIDILCEKIKQHFIIYWVGKESSNVKRTSTAYHVAQMDNTAKIDATQARVFQGDEIEQLTGLFDVGFVLVEGAARSVEEVKADKIMFHIKGAFSNFPKAAQIPISCQNLNSGDQFVLFNQGNAFLWFGQGTSQEEKDFARNMSKGLSNIEEIEEGKETDAFFDLIGGKKEYCHVLSIDYWTHQPRLFQMSNQTGNLKIEEIPNFHQNDLFQEQVFLLDTYDTLFVWVGTGSNVEEKKGAFENAKKFLDARQDERSHEIPIMMVVQSKEPQKFKANFFDWDDTFVANAYQQYTKGSGASKLQEAKQAAEDTSQELKRMQTGSEFLDSSTNFLSYEELKGWPKGVNPQRKEQYLSDEEFEKVFKMSKAEFAKLKEWKQQDLKKNAKLF